MLVDGLYYELSRSDEAIVVNPYDAYKEGQSSFSTRYAGTAAGAGRRFRRCGNIGFLGDGSRPALPLPPAKRKPPWGI